MTGFIKWLGDINISFHVQNVEKIDVNIEAKPSSWPLEEDFLGQGRGEINH